MSDDELDVRPLGKLDKHPRVFATYDSLAVGESFVLINNHDPKHLRDEFDTDEPNSSAGNTSNRARGVADPDQ
jgi:uncharacterized protein (DUF2249 family)